MKGVCMVEIFNALAHENRLGIIALLLDQPLCVCDLEGNLKLTQSNVSRHLSVLRQSKLIKSFKSQQWVYYAIDHDFMKLHPKLWDYLTHMLNEEPYKKMRDQIAIVSNCSGPIPITLQNYHLEKEKI